MQLNFWNTFSHLGINMPDAFATKVVIPTHWKNTVFVSIGADYRPVCEWVLRAGLAYDQTPTNDTNRDPRIPDSDRWWLTMGATYYWTKNISFDAVYEYLFVQNQRVNVVEAVGESATSTLPLEVNRVSARYNGYVNIIGLAMRYRF